MRKYLKTLLIIPLYLLTLPIVFFILLRIPDKIWGCQGFGCFGLIFAIPQLTILLSAPIAFILYILVSHPSIKVKLVKLKSGIHRINLLNRMPFSVRFFLLTLLLMTLSLLVLKKDSSRKYQNDYSFPTITSPSPTIPEASKMPDNERFSNWKTYKNNLLGFSIKYPADFFLSEENDLITIYSKTYRCETENTPPTLPNIKIDASEIKIEIKKVSGKSYEDIWMKEFGFDLTGVINGKIQYNYDGEETYDGRRAYYFYQGAEMTFGRKAILIEETSATAIQINVWTPILVYKCGNELNKYPGISDQILSTFEFTDTKGATNTYLDSKNGYTFQYPSNTKLEEMEDPYSYIIHLSGENINIDIRVSKKHATTELEKISFDDKMPSKTITLDGVPANYYESGGWCNGTCSGPRIGIVAIKGAKTYTLTFSGDLSLSQEENQIFSTFRFLD